MTHHYKEKSHEKGVFFFCFVWTQRLLCLCLDEGYPHRTKCSKWV